MIQKSTRPGGDRPSRSAGPDMKQVSKFMSFVLRHDPASAGLVLDEAGWTSAESLLEALQARGYGTTRKAMEELVRADSKGRYSFSADGERIRANQGHSVAVDLGLAPAEPPDRLYHGTVERFLQAILSEGLRPMERHHVHLSPDRQTASAVGARRGVPVILEVDARAMREAGHVFFRSDNGVWLTDVVPPGFLHVR